MAWASSNLPFAINWSPSGSQSLGQESQNYDNYFLEDPSRIFFPTDELLQDGHIQGSRFNPITEGLSPHVTPHTNHQSFDLQAVNDHLNHHENAITSEHEIPRFSPRASVPITESSSTPKISRSPHSKNGPASDRVKKSNLSRAPLECGWRKCKRPRPFANEGTLIRHIKTQHINPHSIECPKQGCNSLFSRKENMEEHVHRVHKDKCSF